MLWYEPQSSLVFVPFKNLYSTPKTLGIDRIALVSASVEQFPHKNVLIIDAGTCITFDFISHKNEYLGGAISPGIRMRYKALNNFTANLPLLETKAPKNSVGDSTANAMHSGVVQGVLFEIEGAAPETEHVVVVQFGETKIGLSVDNIIGQYQAVLKPLAKLYKKQQSISEDEAKDMGKKFLKGDFSLIDLYEQMEAMKKMGPLTKI